MERNSKLVSWVVGVVLLSLVVPPARSSEGEDSVAAQAGGQRPSFKSSSKSQYNFSEVLYFIPGQGSGQTLASTGAGTLTLIQNFKIGGVGSGLKSALFDLEGISQMKP